MKFYESTYEEYVSSIEKYNLHPELIPVFNKFPKNLKQIENMIVYGSAGCGKYSQVLYLLKRYSPSELKYEKKNRHTNGKNSIQISYVRHPFRDRHVLARLQLKNIMA